MIFPLEGWKSIKKKLQIASFDMSQLILMLISKITFQMVSFILYSFLCLLIYTNANPTLSKVDGSDEYEKVPFIKFIRTLTVDPGPLVVVDDCTSAYDSAVKHMEIADVLTGLTVHSHEADLFLVPSSNKEGIIYYTSVEGLFELRLDLLVRSRFLDVNGDATKCRAILSGSALIVCTEEIVAIDSDTKQVLWKKMMEKGVILSTGGPSSILISVGNRTTCYDTLSGSPLWEYFSFASLERAYFNNDQFYLIHTGGLVCLDLDGTYMWEMSFDNFSYRYLNFIGRMILVFADSNITSLSLNGRINWSLHIPEATSVPAESFGQDLVVGTRNGDIVMIDRGSGVIVDSFPMMDESIHVQLINNLLFIRGVANTVVTNTLFGLYHSPALECPLLRKRPIMVPSLSMFDRLTFAPPETFEHALVGSGAGGLNRELLSMLEYSCWMDLNSWTSEVSYVDSPFFPSNPDDVYRDGYPLLVPVPFERSSLASEILRMKTLRYSEAVGSESAWYPPFMENFSNLREVGTDYVDPYTGVGVYDTRTYMRLPENDFLDTSPFFWSFSNGTSEFPKKEPIEPPYWSTKDKFPSYVLEEWHPRIKSYFIGMKDAYSHRSFFVDICDSYFEWTTVILSDMETMVLGCGSIVRAVRVTHWPLLSVMNQSSVIGLPQFEKRAFEGKRSDLPHPARRGRFFSVDVEELLQQQESSMEVLWEVHLDLALVYTDAFLGLQQVANGTILVSVSLSGTIAMFLHLHPYTGVLMQAHAGQHYFGFKAVPPVVYTTLDPSRPFMDPVSLARRKRYEAVFPPRAEHDENDGLASLDGMLNAFVSFLWRTARGLERAALPSWDPLRPPSTHRFEVSHVFPNSSYRQLGQNTGKKHPDSEFIVAPSEGGTPAPVSALSAFLWRVLRFLFAALHLLATGALPPEHTSPAARSTSQSYVGPFSPHTGGEVGSGGLRGYFRQYSEREIFAFKEAKAQRTAVADMRSGKPFDGDGFNNLGLGYRRYGPMFRPDRNVTVSQKRFLSGSNVSTATHGLDQLDINVSSFYLEDFQLVKGALSLADCACLSNDAGPCAYPEFAIQAFCDDLVRGRSLLVDQKLPLLPSSRVHMLQASRLMDLFTTRGFTHVDFHNSIIWNSQQTVDSSDSSAPSNTSQSTARQQTMQNLEALTWLEAPDRPLQLFLQYTDVEVAMVDEAGRLLWRFNGEHIRTPFLSCPYTRYVYAHDDANPGVGAYTRQSVFRSVHDNSSETLKERVWLDLERESVWHESVDYRVGGFDEWGNIRPPGHPSLRNVTDPTIQATQAQDNPFEDIELDHLDPLEVRPGLFVREIRSSRMSCTVSVPVSTLHDTRQDWIYLLDVHSGELLNRFPLSTSVQDLFVLSPDLLVVADPDTVFFLSPQRPLYVLRYTGGLRGVYYDDYTDRLILAASSRSVSVDVSLVRKLHAAATASSTQSLTWLQRFLNAFTPVPSVYLLVIAVLLVFAPLFLLSWVLREQLDGGVLSEACALAVLYIRVGLGLGVFSPSSSKELPRELSRRMRRHLRTWRSRRLERIRVAAAASVRLTEALALPAECPEVTVHTAPNGSLEVRLRLTLLQRLLRNIPSVACAIEDDARLFTRLRARALRQYHRAILPSGSNLPASHSRRTLIPRSHPEERLKFLALAKMRARLKAKARAKAKAKSRALAAARANARATISTTPLSSPHHHVSSTERELSAPRRSTFRLSRPASSLDGNAPQESALPPASASLRRSSFTDLSAGLPLNNNNPPIGNVVLSEAAGFPALPPQLPPLLFPGSTRSSREDPLDVPSVIGAHSQRASRNSRASPVDFDTFHLDFAGQEATMHPDLLRFSPENAGPWQSVLPSSNSILAPVPSLPPDGAPANGNAGTVPSSGTVSSRLAQTTARAGEGAEGPFSGVQSVGAPTVSRMQGLPYISPLVSTRTGGPGAPVPVVASVAAPSPFSVERMSLPPSDAYDFEGLSEVSSHGSDSTFRDGDLESDVDIGDDDVDEDEDEEETAMDIEFSLNDYVIDEGDEDEDEDSLLSSHSSSDEEVLAAAGAGTGFPVDSLRRIEPLSPRLDTALELLGEDSECDSLTESDLEHSQPQVFTRRRPQPWRGLSGIFQPSQRRYRALQSEGPRNYTLRRPGALDIGIHESYPFRSSPSSPTVALLDTSSPVIRVHGGLGRGPSFFRLPLSRQRTPQRERAMDSLSMSGTSADPDSGSMVPGRSTFTGSISLRSESEVGDPTNPLGL